MKYEIPFRIVVTEPMADVVMAVQRGRDELLHPAQILDTEKRFEFGVTVDLAGGAPNFLGKYAHGPKNTRFLYVNSGEYAGQRGTCWGRRAKLSLTAITPEQIHQVLGDPALCLQAAIPGVGKDGGPICANVKAIEWSVVKK